MILYYSPVCQFPCSVEHFTNLAINKTFVPRMKFLGERFFFKGLNASIILHGG